MTFVAHFTALTVLKKYTLPYDFFMTEGLRMIDQAQMLENHTQFRDRNTFQNV